MEESNFIAKKNLSEEAGAWAENIAQKAVELIKTEKEVQQTLLHHFGRGNDNDLETKRQIKAKTIASIKSEFKIWEKIFKDAHFYEKETKDAHSHEKEIAERRLYICQLALKKLQIPDDEIPKFKT